MATIVLFEDDRVEDMHPITLTRPAFAVTCAAWNLHEVARRVGAGVRHAVRPCLRAITRRDFPEPPPSGGPVLLLNAAVAPDARYADRLRALLDAGAPFRAVTGGRTAAALLPAGARVPEEWTPEAAAEVLAAHDLPETGGGPFRTFDYPFHVIGAIEDLFPANLARRIASGRYARAAEGVFAAEGVEVAPSAVLDASSGPIVLERGVRVMDFAYVHGPVWIGPGSRVIERSSVKDCVSVGHTCKIGGEVEVSVIEAYTNKQHHGFLGHAYVGSWVNLGAGTSNSDLKNTYGTVRVEHRGRRIETGLQFLGCVIGDFTKAAINTSIFTGKTIGVASMLYGYVGQNVPSFCNYARSFGQITESTLDQAIETQRRMFARRKVEQTAEDAELLRAVFERTREERTLSSEPPVL